MYFHPVLVSVLQHGSYWHTKYAKYRLIRIEGCVGPCKHYLSEFEVPPSENNNLMLVFFSLLSQLSEVSCHNSYAPSQIGIAHTQRQPFTCLSH